MLVGRPDTVIVVASELAPFYEFVKPRQEAVCGKLVVLDRRQGKRRRQPDAPVCVERRQRDRRTPLSGAARAQLAVLGFAICHREGAQYVA